MDVEHIFHPLTGSTGGGPDGPKSFVPGVGNNSTDRRTRTSGPRNKGDVPER